MRSYIESLSQKTHFPNPIQSDEDGILCVGGDLSPEILLDAYYHGIFPWPHEGVPLLWFSPKHRGVLIFDELHIPKSLRKFQKKSPYRFTINQAFPEVIQGCAQAVRKDQKGTWITDEIIGAYKDLQDLGFILSVECWSETRLVGGLYGVLLCGVFSGESMFGLEDNVSKLCFLETVRYLQSQKHQWMDIQMITPVTEMLGGKYVDQIEFLKMLDVSHKAYLMEPS